MEKLEVRNLKYHKYIFHWNKEVVLFRLLITSSVLFFSKK